MDDAFIGSNLLLRAWWAMVFPIITLDAALLQLAKAMDSPAFRVLATALFVW